MSEYRRLIKFVLPHLGVLIAAGICMTISSVFSGVSMGMIIPLVDNIIRGKKIACASSIHTPPFILNIINKINSMPTIELLQGMIILVMILWLLKNLFEFLQTYLMNDVSQRVVRDVKDIIYQKLLTLSMDFYSKNSTAKLTSRITYDAAIIRDSISSGLTDLIYQPVQLVIYLIILLAVKVYFSISWVLVGVILALFPLVIYPVAMIGRRLKAISKQSQEKMADITTTLYETISGIRVVKAFSMEGYEAEKFKKQNGQFYRLSMKSVKRMTMVSPITEFIGIVCIAVILWVAGRYIITGVLSCGAFITFLVALLSLMKPVKRLTNLYGINQQALAAAARIFDVLDTRPSVAESPGAVNLAPIRKNVAFEGVWFKYDDKDVLKDINLEVKVGEIAAFVGPSGTGKTTLVNLIPRFYDPSRGGIKIDGVDIRRASLKSLRDQIGLVTQETILFDDTAAANISYGMKERKIDDIIRAARIANAHSFIMKLPKGYDTIIGERGFRLSGGEKQRLSIARAVFKDPPILILDEATSQLDTESEVLVQEAIDHLMEGRTVFAIAHRLSTIKHADKIYVMDNGRIVEVGSHDELLKASGLYKRLYDMQFKDNMLR